MTKTTSVRTNDPDKAKFDLVVRGRVEKVADIKPVSVFMDGKPGEKLEAVVTITPSDKFTFTISEVTKQYNTGIDATLVPPEKGEKAWKLVVKSTSDKADDLYEVLTLETDSEYLPSIAIRAYAIFDDRAEPEDP